MEVENIYQQTNEGKDIFEFYLGYEIKRNKKYHSIFRDEKNPSMAFYTSDQGGWRVKDFGLGNNVGPLEFVQLLIKTGKLQGEDSFVYVKERIVQDLHLDKPTYRKTKFSKTPVRPKINETIEETKSNFSIVTHRCEWQQQDHIYWSNYKITEPELQAYGIYALDYYSLVYNDPTRKNPTIRRTKDNPIIYEFELKDWQGIAKTKIYCPLNVNKEFKWLGNTNTYTLQGYEQLQRTNEFLLLTSSLKDGIVLKGLLKEFKPYHEQKIAFVAGNSESVFLPSPILTELQAKYSMLTLFDWDATGIKFSKMYELRYRIPSANHLLRPYGIKDIANLMEFCSREEKKEFTTNLLKLIYENVRSV